MVPTAILKRAQETGLAGIGICDHNSCENVPAVRAASSGTGITVFGGMEINSREEIHILALFGDDDALFDLQEVIYSRLPGENDEEAFGHQWIVDGDDYVIAKNPRLLAGACDFSMEEIIDLVHQRGGLAIASHVNRLVNSVISQLGFMPDSADFDGIEIADTGAGEDEIPGLQYGKNRVQVTFSDAHTLSEIGKKTTVLPLEDLRFSDVRAWFARGL
jgi:predicted metal-dependent phosphoesterase TrpH